MIYPFYQDRFITLYCGDAREIIKQTCITSIQTCITSPPYFGLRDYGTAEWLDGDPECAHVGDGAANNNRNFIDREGRGSNKAAIAGGSHCRHCGATRIDQQIGLESTPLGFVESMLGVFNQVRGALRIDGTVWLNLGDSYATSGTRQGNRDGIATNGIAQDHRTLKARTIPGFKNKDLIGMPWRVAFALQDAGWYLRQDIVWSKPNPMPEPVFDRCVKAHEYIFLLSRSPNYFFDAQAIREGDEIHFRKAGGYNNHAEQMADHTKPFTGKNGFADSDVLTIGHNKRSVWQITAKSFSDAHFATFPPELPEICIRAATRRGDVVLDPFAGAGTTLIVAKKMGRKSIGIELNPAYCEMIVSRIQRETALPLFDGDYGE